MTSFWLCGHCCQGTHSISCNFLSNKYLNPHIHNLEVSFFVNALQISSHLSLTNIKPTTHWTTFPSADFGKQSIMLIQGKELDPNPLQIREALSSSVEGLAHQLPSPELCLFTNGHPHLCSFQQNSPPLRCLHPALWDRDFPMGRMLLCRLKP